MELCGTTFVEHGNHESWRFEYGMLRAMREPDVQMFNVDGVEVSLVQDVRGAHWECSACRGDCEHKLKAAAWVTLKSWARRGVIH